MKIKYKKIIFLVTLSIMGIGLLTFSAENGKSQAKESLSKDVVKEASDTKDQNVTPTVTAVPTPTPLPVYNMEEDKNREITEAFLMVMMLIAQANVCKQLAEKIIEQYF